MPFQSPRLDYRLNAPFPLMKTYHAPSTFLSHSFSPLILFALALILPLTACKLDPNEQFIQGTWEIAKTNSENRYFRWEFYNGTFIRAQEVDSATSLYTTGQYRFVESDGDNLTIELFDFNGDRIAYENNPITLSIEIDRVKDTARIQNVDFVRISP